MTTTTISTDGTIEISCRARTESRRARTSAARLYVQPSAAHDAEPPRGPKCTDPKCEPCNRRQAAGMARETDHAAWRRYRRAAIAARRAVVDKAQPMLTMLTRPVRVRWSDKAGCSCGCSPGFIVIGPDTGLDVWIAERDADVI